MDLSSIILTGIRDNINAKRFLETLGFVMPTAKGIMFYNWAMTEKAWRQQDHYQRYLDIAVRLNNPEAKYQKALDQLSGDNGYEKNLNSAIKSLREIYRDNYPEELKIKAKNILIKHDITCDDEELILHFNELKKTINEVVNDLYKGSTLFGVQNNAIMITNSLEYTENNLTKITGQKVDNLIDILNLSVDGKPSLRDTLRDAFSRSNINYEDNFFVKKIIDKMKELISQEEKVAPGKH